MTFTTQRRWRRLLVTGLLTAALLPAVADAQTAPPPTTTPRPPTQTAPSEPGTPRSRSLQREIELSRWNRKPVLRLGQDYTLRSDDAARHVVVISGDARIEGRVFEDVVVVFGDVYLANTAVVDGNVITSRGAGTAIAFAAAVVRHLVDEATANDILARIQYQSAG